MLLSSICFFRVIFVRRLRNQSIEYCHKKEFHSETLKTNDAIKLTYKDTP